MLQVTRKPVLAFQHREVRVWGVQQLAESRFGMAGVRLVAQIFGWIGWITLVFGLLGLALVVQQLLSAFGPAGGGLLALGASAGAAVPLLLLALGPFTVWALLTALCEIYVQHERAYLVLDELRRQRTVVQRDAGTRVPSQADVDLGVPSGQSTTSAMTAPGSPTGNTSLSSPTVPPLSVGQSVRLTREIRLLESPQPNAAYVFSIPVGATIEVLEKRDTWQRVRSQSGASGWTRDEIRRAP